MSGSTPTPGREASCLGQLGPWLPALLYMGLIFHLSSLSNPLPELTARVWDKALHCIEYGGLGALLLFALRSRGIAPDRACLAAVGAASLYAASDELHQAFVPGRTCDVHDWLADTVGATLVAGGWIALRCLAGRRLDIHGERR